jgi:hypothetical protein
MMDAAAGFWIFLAAVVVAGIWKETREKAQKTETLRLILEKTGAIDEARLKELFSSAGEGRSKPGDGYRALRVLGTITMFVGAGLAMVFVSLHLFSKIDQLVIGVSVSAFIVLVGCGMFYSSRFCERPER